MQRWLNWRSFVELTEAFTAPMNIFWLLMGVTIAQYYYQTVNWINVGLFFLNIICFDFAVNITDNYYDYVHARDRKVYAKYTNVIGRLNLPLRGVWLLGFCLYVLSLVPAIIILWKVGWVSLIVGIPGYLIGIFYAAGRFPINATPFCELAASVGITYMVQLVCVMVAANPYYSLDWVMAGRTFMICLPVVLVSYTIQLANNVADLDEDIRNNRHTLAYFLGRERSLVLMRFLQLLGVLWPVINWFAGMSPWTVLLSMPILVPMWMGMRPYYDNPDKKLTYFPLVKAASLFFIGYTLFLAVGVWF